MPNGFKVICDDAHGATTEQAFDTEAAAFGAYHALEGFYLSPTRVGPVKVEIVVMDLEREQPLEILRIDRNGS